jgi:hypothetical protein
MTRIGLWAVALVLSGILLACSDVTVSRCLEDAVLERAAIAEEGTVDWQAEIDSVVAVAPADSVLDFVVYVAVRSRAAFEAWAEGHQVPIGYAFFGFSGYRIAPKVRDLVRLKDAPGITGLDWGLGSISADADCR